MIQLNRVILQLWQLPVPSVPHHARCSWLNSLSTFQNLGSHCSRMYTASQRSETPNLGQMKITYISPSPIDFSANDGIKKMGPLNTFHQPFLGVPKLGSCFFVVSRRWNLTLSFPNHWIWSDLHRTVGCHMGKVAHALSNYIIQPPKKQTGNEQKNPLEKE